MDRSMMPSPNLKYDVVDGVKAPVMEKHPWMGARGDKFMDDVLMSNEAVDRSVAQTRRTGVGYAVMPKPVFESWVRWAGVNGSRLPWRLVCIGPDNGTGEASVDETDDGDVVICLKDSGHDGECGGRQYLKVADQQ